MGKIKEIDYAQMAENDPNPKAKDRFKSPAYQIKKLVREQGRQIEQNKGVNMDGQVNPD